MCGTINLNKIFFVPKILRTLKSKIFEVWLVVHLF